MGHQCKKMPDHLGEDPFRLLYLHYKLPVQQAGFLAPPPGGQAKRDDARIRAFNHAGDGQTVRIRYTFDKKAVDKFWKMSTRLPIIFILSGSPVGEDP